MNTAKLRRNYDKLEDLERFRLVLAAWERDDLDEIRVLRETCPRGTYKMSIWRYRQMFPALRFTVGAAVKGILIDGWLMVLSRGIDHAHDDEDDDRPIGGDVEMARRVLCAWDGLEVFCDELGITRDQALAQVIPAEAIDRVVDFARIVLEHEEALLRIMTEIHCRETGGDIEETNAARAVNLAAAHDAAVREFADLLRAVWDCEVQ